MPDKCCLGCHFLITLTLREKGLEPAPSLVDAATRERLAKGDAPELGPNRWFTCDRQVWDAANLAPEDDLLSIIRHKRLYKKEPCFFYRYTPSMFLPAARELEQRAADRREMKIDRNLTNKSVRQSQKAFWVAAIALIVSILATAANLIWNIWQHFNPHKP